MTIRNYQIRNIFGAVAALLFISLLATNHGDTAMAHAGVFAAPGSTVEALPGARGQDDACATQRIDGPLGY